MINKQKKGISLIVLVITIIVMIILAASVIVSLNNTSIIDKAGQAVDETNESELEQMDALEYLDKFTASVENPWDGSTKESFADGNGTENQPYLISNAAELVYFAKLVNEGNTFEGKYVELTANINLNNIEFTPIGMGNSTVSDESQWTSSTVYFNGTFDGKGHIISNVNINKPEVRGVGLFGVTYDKAVIKNVEIFSGNIYGRAAVAGIVGYNKAEISNCINRANVTAVDSETIGNSGQLAGGIAGASYAGNIINCKNYGNVLGEDDVALRSRGKNVGGIVGAITSEKAITIANCYNYGNIATNYQQVGGIVGSIEAAEGSIAKVENCENKGKVAAIKPKKEFTENVALGYAGGIVGWTCESRVEIVNCKNSGAVSTTTIAGGISGVLDINAKIINCTNSGTISGEKYIGGMAGVIENGYVEKSINYGNVSASSQQAGGISGVCQGTGVVVSNCENNGEITGYGINGGLLASLDVGAIIEKSINKGRVYASYQQAAGVVGQLRGTVRECENVGKIEAGTHAGGIVAYSQVDTASILKSKNSGSVTSASIAAGIIGITKSASFIVEDCSNSGEITATNQQAAGIAAQSYGTIRNCFNTGAIKSEAKELRGIAGGIVAVCYGNISNSYNKGAITVNNASETIDDAGGVVGYINSGTISNSYNKGTVEGENAGGIIGRINTEATGQITFANTYYYTTGNLKGVANTEDVTGQYEKTTTNLDTFEAFKNSSFYAK